MSTDNNFKSKCPRKLSQYPDRFCDLAVLRLKVLRNLPNELPEEEEATLPGCPYAINCQTASYCFFKYMGEKIPNKALSDLEIAHFTCVSEETVKKTNNAFLEKIKQDPIIKELGDD